MIRLKKIVAMIVKKQTLSWFDCMCSDSGNETKSNKKGIEMSPDSRDLDDETKSDQKVIEVKKKDYFYNFNSLSNWSNYPFFYVPELSK